MSRGHKYGAKPTLYDGIRFASKAECRRYVDLRILERAGHIRNLELQPVFPIEVMNPANGEMVLCGVYKADFKYVDLPFRCPERVVVEDVKGFSTDVYRLKRRLVQAIYGITITEVR